MKLRGNLIIESKSPSPLFIIKPDQNFHIYVHGTPELIEQDEDKEEKFYKVYYSENLRWFHSKNQNTKT